MEVWGEWPAPGAHEPRAPHEEETGAAPSGRRLVTVIADDGVGLPADFDVESATSLGLQIVRTLIVGELGGRLDFRPRPGGGTEVVVDIPLDHDHRPGRV